MRPEGDSIVLNEIVVSQKVLCHFSFYLCAFLTRRVNEKNTNVKKLKPQLSNEKKKSYRFVFIAVSSRICRHQAIFYVTFYAQKNENKNDFSRKNEHNGDEKRG